MGMLPTTLSSITVNNILLSTAAVAGIQSSSNRYKQRSPALAKLVKHAPLVTILVAIVLFADHWLQTQMSEFVRDEHL
jgi:hypothetical protein